MKLICKKTNKVLYRYRKDAWVKADYFFKKLGTVTGVYRCKYCRKFHLSKQVQFTPNKSAKLQLMEKENE